MLGFCIMMSPEVQSNSIERKSFFRSTNLCNHATVAKAVHCAKSTVKYWLKRWIQIKDLKDSTRSGRPHVTTLKQDQRIISIAEKETFITTRDIANNLNRKQVVVSERTVQRRLNEAGT